MISTGIAHNNAAALPLRSLSQLNTANANHTQRAINNNCTIEMDNGQTFIAIPDNIHFFIFLGNVTFIIIIIK